MFRRIIAVIIIFEMICLSAGFCGHVHQEKENGECSIAVVSESSDKQLHSHSQQSAEHSSQNSHKVHCACLGSMIGILQPTAFHLVSNYYHLYTPNFSIPKSNHFNLIDRPPAVN